MLVYSHLQEQKQTLVLDCPSFEACMVAINLHLSNPTNIPVTVKMLFGVAKLHPSDRYVKRIGRNVAYSNAIETAFKVDQVYATTDRIMLSMSHGQYGVLFKLKKGSKRIITEIKKNVW